MDVLAPTAVAVDEVLIEPEPISRVELLRVARDKARVRLSDRALLAIGDGRGKVEALLEHPSPIYGLSTGFGALAGHRIPSADRRELQRRLVRSHAAGTGAEVASEVVRAMMVIRLSTMATGRTGVSVRTARGYADLVCAGITPVVRQYGSLGCSGDLAPLAHVALALIGEGTVRDWAGRARAAATALAEAGLARVELAQKEGLSLLNGTDGMLAQLVLAGHDLGRLLTLADITAAMSLEAVLGNRRPYLAELHRLRPHPGQAASAGNLTRLLEGSRLATDAPFGPGSRVQEPYSLRCAPQVCGAARDTLAHAHTVADRELAAAIDNPVLSEQGTLETNGNFHGAPLGYVLDFLAIAAADLASISERRTDVVLDPGRNNGLPAFLAEQPGLDSGYMIAHYTQADVVSGLKRLAAPASTDSIPTSAMQEDHVSMGWAAAGKLRRSIDGLSRVLAIEAMTAARAIDLRGPQRSAPATAAVLRVLRERVPGPGEDRYLAPEIDAAIALATTGRLTTAAEGVTGPLE